MPNLGIVSIIFCEIAIKLLSRPLLFMKDPKHDYNLAQFMSTNANEIYESRFFLLGTHGLFVILVSVHSTEREHVRGEGEALYNPSIHNIGLSHASERKGLMVPIDRNI